MFKIGDVVPMTTYVAVRATAVPKGLHMNSDTGKVYTNDAAIADARTRGERLVPISDRAAKLLGIGRAKRLQDLRARRKLRKSHDARQNAKS